MLKRLVQTNDDVVPAILRLLLGVVMFPHGAQKMLGWFGGYGFAGTMQGMSQSLPAAIVFLVIIIEFFGSIALIVGFLTRLAALGVLAVMLGALFTIHLNVGFFMNWSGQQAGEGFEYHLLAIAICLALMVAGGGRWSIDRTLSDKPLARR